MAGRGAAGRLPGRVRHNRQLAPRFLEQRELLQLVSPHFADLELEEDDDGMYRWCRDDVGLLVNPMAATIFPAVRLQPWNTGMAGTTEYAFVCVSPQDRLSRMRCGRWRR